MYGHATFYPYKPKTLLQVMLNSNTTLPILNPNFVNSVLYPNSAICIYGNHNLVESTDLISSNALLNILRFRGKEFFTV